MLQLKTTAFGEQPVDPDTVLNFPAGLAGFESHTRFKLFHEDSGKEIVHWLQSVEDADLRFPVADPTQFGIHYSFLLSDEETALLELDNPEDALVLIVLYKEDEQTGIRGSIAAPLVINARSRKGVQKPLQNLEPSVLLRELSSSVEIVAA